MRQETTVELAGPPLFRPGDKVVCKRYVKNDGTFMGRELGEVLVGKGDLGYVRDVGTYLQQFYIYAVEWIDRGTVVGMRGKELLRPDDYAAWQEAAQARAAAAQAKFLEQQMKQAEEARP